jgi:ribosomal-protein-alanine N-acetyltransferase
MSGVIRPARLADVPALALLTASSGYEIWDEARFIRELSLDRTRALMAEHAEGFAIGWSVLDELELHLLVVDPAHRRKGLGRALLAAFEEGASRIQLEVSEHNTAALALYRAAGYTEVGRRPHYYGADDAAILMTRIRR